jgi:hypothetical protein
MKPASFHQPLDSPNYPEIVHKPNGFNINQFKSEFKQEVYEPSRMQQIARS